MSLDSSPETKRVYERFQLIINGPALFNAIVTGLDLDVFPYLSKNPQSTFEELREYTGIPSHKLRILLQALCATELLEKEDGRYTNSSVAEELLADEGPESWRHILIGWQRIYYPAFTHMTSALRTGTNTGLASYPGSEPTLYQRLAKDSETEGILHASMGAFTQQSMPGLLENAEIGSLRHLLDVGGGDGTTAAALAKRHPETRITVFDMPSVTRIAEQAVQSGSDSQVRLHPGDIFDDPFPRDVDGILFSHVLEVFDAEQILHLLGKAYEALPSGGKIFLYGFNVTENETRGLLAARLSLYLNVLASGQGMAYPAADYEAWLRQVGFSTVRSVTDLPYEHGLTIGTKA
ncbi:methyltransferase [Streptomyces swartbergensis]|uniref:methyltransferase n=1 Tax=Streptomyces swartbergensis TaxID=487165 RepID=UPI003829CE63